MTESEGVETMQKHNSRKYTEYHFNFAERVLYTLLFFAAGAVVGFVFYGNLFMKDGELTFLSYISNGVVCTLGGVASVVLFLPVRKKQLIESRKKALRLQFREMLSSLSTAYASGENTNSAFLSAEKDLTAQFGESSDIAVELHAINSGVMNANQKVEKMLLDLGVRSGLEDVEDFANVFQVCLEKGGNLNSVVRRSYDLIGDKLAINEEIQTKITSNQMQQTIMSVVPIFMIGFLRFSSSSFAASFASFKGVVAMTVAAAIFIFSYLYGKKITDVKG